MLTSRITKEKNVIFKSPLWRSVCVLVRFLTLKSLTLDVVWLLSQSFDLNH